MTIKSTILYQIKKLIFRSRGFKAISEQLTISVLSAIFSPSLVTNPLLCAVKNIQA